MKKVVSRTTVVVSLLLLLAANFFGGVGSLFSHKAAATSELVAAYSFDEGLGTTLYDSSGHDLKGTIANATWDTNGKYGGALSFDGNGDRVMVSDSPLLDLTDNMTVMAWVKPSSLPSWMTVVTKERTDGLSYGLYGSTDGKPNVPAFYAHTADTDRQVGGIHALTPDTWVHLAATYDGAYMRLYVNGELVTTRSYAGTVATSNEDLSIGGSAAWGEYFTGLIDEVRIYNTARAQADIQVDMDKPIDTNTWVDFTGSLRPLHPLAIGLGESAYSENDPYLTANGALAQKVKALGAKAIRIELRYNIPGNPSSGIRCEAVDCPAGVDGEAWVRAIKAAGAEPVISVPMRADDAANLVKYFNVTTKNRVKRWIISNEPDAKGVKATDYSKQFNTIYDAMKAVDKTIEVGGPALSQFDVDYLEIFLAQSGNRTDFVDYHAYGLAGEITRSEAELLKDTALYQENYRVLHNIIQNIAPTRAQDIEIVTSEWSLEGDSRQYTQFSTVWSASVLGRLLSSGSLSLAYGWERSDGATLYSGIGMYTGAGLFSGIGQSIATASTELQDVEVYAFANPKRIVLINKHPTNSKNGVMGLKGANSGAATLWRKDTSQIPGTPPTNVGTVPIVHGAFSYTLPPYSVTTILLP